MQMHSSLYNPPASALEETIEAFAALGVEVHITELDMTIYTSENQADYGNNPPQELMVKQGYRYKDIFDVLRRQADHIGSVTFWGIGDDYSWLNTRYEPDRSDHPLLFDRDLQAKYAYWGIIDPSMLPPYINEENSPFALPEIDGEAERLWQLTPWLEVPPNDSLGAHFQTRWQEDGLYVFVDVDDATADDDDSVTLFLDENNDKTPGYGDDDQAITFTRDMATSPTAAIMPKEGGYRLEAVVPFSATASMEDMVGFDLRISDASNPTDLLSWNDLTHNQNTDTTNFGTLTLIEETKLLTIPQGTPVINAHEDEVWANAAEFSTDVWAGGSSGATADVKALWDDNHLYLYAVISDTVLSEINQQEAYQQDSIEVFLDQNNAKTVTYEDDDRQYRINYRNDYSFNNASEENITSTAMIIEGGYIIELAITVDSVELRNGQLLGFDFQVNDDADDNGSRDNIAKWKDPTNDSYRNTSRLGVILIEGEDEFGVDLSGDDAGGGPASSVVSYTLSVTNTGTAVDTFSVAISSTWTTEASVEEITLEAGEMANFVVDVTIPVNANEGSFDVATVVVTSQSDTMASDSARLTTTMTPARYNLYLPLIPKAASAALNR